MRIYIDIYLHTHAHTFPSDIFTHTYIHLLPTPGRSLRIWCWFQNEAHLAPEDSL